MPSVAGFEDEKVAEADPRKQGLKLVNIKIHMALIKLQRQIQENKD